MCNIATRVELSQPLRRDTPFYLSQINNELKAWLLKFKIQAYFACVRWVHIGWVTLWKLKCTGQLGNWISIFFPALLWLWIFWAVTATWRVLAKRASTFKFGYIILYSIIDYSLFERGWSIYWGHVWWRNTLPVENLTTTGWNWEGGGKCGLDTGIRGGGLTEID